MYELLWTESIPPPFPLLHMACWCDPHWGSHELFPAVRRCIWHVHSLCLYNSVCVCECACVWAPSGTGTEWRRVVIIFPLFNTTLHDGSPHPPGHMMDRPNTHCDTSQQIISANTHAQRCYTTILRTLATQKHARQFCVHDALSLCCRWMWQVGVTLVKKHVEQSPVCVFLRQRRNKKPYSIIVESHFLPLAPKIFFKMSTFVVSTSNFGWWLCAELLLHCSDPLAENYFGVLVVTLSYQNVHFKY